MDKLKKVFSPGSSKDDEVLYGDAEDRRKASVGTAATTEPETLHPTEGAQKEHGILRQILNPGGEKYDDQAYGTTATTAEPDPTKLQTDPSAHKDHTIVDQLLNPGNDKYDERQFSATAATPGDRSNSIAPEAPSTVGPDVQLATDPGQKDHSVLRQILNPGGAKYDDVAFGTTAHAAGDIDPSEHRSDSTANPDRSISRQILNPNHDKYDPVVHGSGQADSTSRDYAAPAAGAAVISSVADNSAETRQDIGTGSNNVATTTQSTGQTLPDRTTQPYNEASSVAAPSNSTTQPPSYGNTDESHLGRDALLAGGLGTAGAGAYAATRGNDDFEGKITERPHPLNDKAGQETSQLNTQGTGTSSTNPTTSSYTTAASNDAHINPVGAPEESLVTSTGDAGLGRDATIVGGVTAEGASTQLNTAPADVQDATYTDRTVPVGGGVYHHTHGPHPTDIANKLDPHVPGEFPTEKGLDRHDARNAPSGDLVTGQDTIPSEPATSEEKKDKVPLVASIASAIGLGGLVGGAASKEKSADSSQATESTTSTSHPSSGSHPIQTTTNTLPAAPVDAQGTSATTTDGKNGEQHHGRDAAITGGVLGSGAAGYGAYEATQNRGTTEPAQQSLGTTSQSVDPVSQPSQSTSIGSAQPGAEKKDDHHYARDAAIVGGTGAAGYGAYEATRDGHGAEATSGPTDSISRSADPMSTTTQTTTTTTLPGQSKSTDGIDSGPQRVPDKSAHREAAIIGGSTGGIDSSLQQVPDKSAHREAAIIGASTDGVDSSTHQVPDKSANREAAIIGGSAATGYGTYEATKDREDTGPASKTIGPHESNVANVLDPRVKPEPEKMKDSKTVGPYSSDLANKADPRVQSDPAKAQEQDRTKDTALAEGAGAVGAGGVAAAAVSGNDNRATQESTSALEEKIRKTAALRTGNPDAAAAYAHERAGESHEPRLQITGQQEDDKSVEKSEKKHGFLHKILHPGHKSEDKETHKSHEHKSLDEDNRVSTDDHGHNKLHKKAVEQTETSRDEGTVVEPHTGLPMNVGKYGSGAGGTDGAAQIEGFHETGAGQTGEGVTGPDWDAIKKANTPY